MDADRFCRAEKSRLEAQAPANGPSPADSGRGTSSSLEGTAAIAGLSPVGWGRGVNLRRSVLCGLVVFSTLSACRLMWDVLEVHDSSPLALVSLLLFAINFAWISVAFWTAMAGLVLRALRRDPITLARVQDRVEGPACLRTRTAVVMPIYNEDTRRVFAGVEAVYRSLCRTGQAAHFDFFILSDSTNLEIAAAEAEAWQQLAARTGGAGRIFYRRRSRNIGRKAGNIADFCRNWGRRYDHMVVLDADSIMAGETVVRLAHLMQENPGVGIIQTIPLAVNRETMFARFVQFAVRLNGPVLATGLCYWQLGEANYWGHNAIIRVAAFMEHCGLPRLPGRAPLGGEILSHDFVEAALMLRGGLSVWLLPDAGGSFEEVPTNVVDFATRDRRWCQGNLQHTKLIAAPGLRWVSRVHLVMGVLAYVSPLLWLILLGISSFEFVEHAVVGHRYFLEDRTLFPVWPVSKAVEQISLYCLSMGILLVPKLLCALQALLDRETRRAFGGGLALILSTMAEVVFAAVLAPVMMLFHSHFVVSTLLGRTVVWETQSREDRGLGLEEALARHGKHTLIGVVWAATMAIWCPCAAAWLAPVFVGLVFSIPFCLISSRSDVGLWLRQRKIFAIPEELAPPPVLGELARALEALPAAALPAADLEAAVPAPLPGSMLPQPIHVHPARQPSWVPVEDTSSH